jgi:hypothetical protein
MPDHADSLGFVVRITLRANSDDRIVINRVPIGGRVGPSIGFIVASCLTAASNTVAELLVSKPMVIMRRSSYS